MSLRHYRESYRRRGYTTCHYCRCDLDFDGNSHGKRFATIDHKFPSVKGGRSHEDNFVLACRECNSIKNDEYSYEEFRELVQSPQDLVALRLQHQIRNQNKKDNAKTVARKNLKAFYIAMMYTLSGIKIEGSFV